MRLRRRFAVLRHPLEVKRERLAHLAFALLTCGTRRRHARNVAGEATRRGGDFIGRGVHVAARVGAAGAAGETLATAEAMAVAGAGCDASDVHPLPLKGIAEPVDTVQISYR